MEKVCEYKIWRYRLSDYLVLLSISFYSIIFSFFTIMRHYSFRSYAWDLGIFVQSFASASQGLLFNNNLEVYFSPTGSFFGVHFSPILYILVPFYIVFPFVETLLILQAIILGLGAIPVYLISKHVLKQSFPSLLISIGYLLSPLLQGINWYDFHMQAFLPLFFLSATYFLKKRKLVYTIFFLLLALMTIEQASYFVLAYIVYIVWELRKEIQGLFQFKISLANITPFIILIMTIVWIIFSNGVLFSLNPNPPEELQATMNYAALDIDSITEIPFKIITNPILGLQALAFDLPLKILYFFYTFTPGIFFIILSPVAALPSLLWLVISLFSNHKPYYEIGFQYTALTLPFVTIAMIDGIKKFSNYLNPKFLKKAYLRISLILLIFTLIIASVSSPLSAVHKPNNFSYFLDFGVSSPSFVDSSVIDMLNTLPEDASIITTNIIFPHVSTYLNAYAIPPKNAPSQRIYDNNLVQLKKNTFEYIIIDTVHERESGNALFDNFVRGDPNYKLFIHMPGVYVYKYNYDGIPTKINLRFTAKEIVEGPGTKIIQDQKSFSKEVIVLEAKEQDDRLMWYGPYIVLTPGEYTANVIIKSNSLVDDKIIKLDIVANQDAFKLGEVIVKGSDFSSINSWRTFSIPFNITQRTFDVEFRGVETAADVTIQLDYIEIIAK